jgi:hypothetical protein
MDMIDPQLQRKLAELERLRRGTRLAWSLAVAWILLVLAVVLLLLIRAATGNDWVPSRLTVLLAGLAIAAVLWWWNRRRPLNPANMVPVLEREFPEMRPLLSTAAEQQPDPETGAWHFLQRRVISQVLMHPRRQEWLRTFRRRQMVGIVLHTIAIAGFGVMLAFLSRPPSAVTKPWLASTTVVEPGDVEVERGRGIVITIRFDERPPAEATLVLQSESGQVRRIPLERHLADPLFGTSLREVMESGVYQIEYGNEKTREYRVTVFDYPALVQADASLTFPEYTGLTNRHIPDTLRISAVEGAQLDYWFRLNKPVARARLVGKGQEISLTTATNETAELNDFVLSQSGRYALQLVDEAGRTNRRTAEIVVQVLPNRRPELKLTFPRGDPRVSRLEELQLQAEATDDFGLVRYGFGYGVAGNEPRMVELGQATRGGEKRQLQQMIDIEELGLEVNQVISYFAWADDRDPAGEPRRTFTDMFFAEVRPFEEIFRADQSGEDGGGQEQGQGEQGGGGGNESTRLTELQKQIVIATWKIQREKRGVDPLPKP